MQNSIASAPSCDGLDVPILLRQVPILDDWPADGCMSRQHATHDIHTMSDFPNLLSTLTEMQLLLRLVVFVLTLSFFLHHFA